MSTAEQDLHRTQLPTCLTSGTTSHTRAVFQLTDLNSEPPSSTFVSRKKHFSASQFPMFTHGSEKQPHDPTGAHPDG